MVAPVDRLDTDQFTFLAFFSAGASNRTHTQLTKYATDFIPCAISNVERSSEGLLKPDSCGALKTLANWFQRTATSSKKAVQVEKYLKNDKTATHSARQMILVLIVEMNVAEVKLYRQRCSLKRPFLTCRNTNNSGS